jgi:hypothetical protein
LAKKGTTLQNKKTSPNFETIKRLIKQKTQEKFFQEAIASSNKIQWQNIKSTWENNKNKPRKQAVANFQLSTGHDCLAAHVYLIKIFSHNYCTICKLKNTIMYKDHLLECPKLDHTAKELSKLYWDARRLMELIQDLPLDNNNFTALSFIFEVVNIVVFICNICTI